MPELSLKELLQKMLAELDKHDEQTTIAELRAELEELKGRRVTRDEVVELLRDLSPEEREKLGLPERLPAPDPDPDPDPNPDPDPDPGPDPDPDPTNRTRPGRKAGELYEWDVDEEGNVIPLGMPKLYSGEDEPERVELPPVAE